MGPENIERSAKILTTHFYCPVEPPSPPKKIRHARKYCHLARKYTVTPPERLRNKVYEQADVP